jgi:hypothetical protein
MPRKTWMSPNGNGYWIRNMFLKPKSRITTMAGSGWRAYQDRLKRAQRNTAQKQLFRRYLKFILPIIVVSVMVYLSISGSFGSFPYNPKETPQVVDRQTPSPKTEAALSFNKEDLHHFIDSRRITNSQDNSFEAQANGKRLLVQTRPKKFKPDCHCCHGPGRWPYSDHGGL